MANRERRKGREGEAETKWIWQNGGMYVRDLEGSGDHLIVKDSASGAPPFTLHEEVKRQETARPWAWMAQAEKESPPGAVPIVSFRRNKSPWYSIIRTDDLARLLA